MLSASTHLDRQAQSAECGLQRRALAARAPAGVAAVGRQVAHTRDHVVHAGAARARVLARERRRRGARAGRVVVPCSAAGLSARAAPPLAGRASRSSAAAAIPSSAELRRTDPSHLHSLRRTPCAAASTPARERQ